MADAAQVDMLNTALAILGQEPVAALDDAALEQSVAATKLLRHVEIARDTVLGRHGWVCALEYPVLVPATLPAYSNWRYPYAYLLPANALRVWEIEGQLECDWGPRWQAGTAELDSAARKIIRADTAGPLNVAYVRRANWQAMDAHVRDAVAHDTAARGAYAVTGDLAKAAKVQQAAEAKVLLAISIDGTQEGGQPSLAPSTPARIRNAAR